MTHLIIYFLLAYGICNIIIFANGPFHVFRKMHLFFQKYMPMMEEMTTCFICLPTWCGMCLSAVNLLLFPDIEFSPMMSFGISLDYWYVIVFFDGLLTSGGCWLVHTLQEMMERIWNNGEQ